MRIERAVRTSVALSLAAALSLSAATQAAAPPRPSLPTAGADWTHATGDIGNTRYSALSQINTGNVGRLSGAWASEAFDDGANIRATPVVQNGVIFATAGAKVYAIDGKTGKRLWVYEPLGAPLAVSGMGGGNTRPQGKGTPNVQGPAVGEGKLFVGLSDGHVIALDQKTGKLIWDKEIGVEARPQRGGVSASPVYSNGVIYTSLTFDEARYVGRAVALDAKTGKQLWRWNTIPGVGEPGRDTWGKDQDLVEGAVWKMGGASVWLPPVVDEKLGTAFFVTGNPSPNRTGGLRPGDNFYSSSLVALDTKTGKIKWHFQAVHHDMWEMDIAVPPVAYDVTMADGKVRPGIGVMRPEGTLFFFDRETGKPLYPIEERAVTQNPVHATSPTQPFPVGHGSVVEKPCNEWKSLPKGIELRCSAFEPPFEDAFFLMPGPTSRSSQMSYSPQSGLFYVNGNERLQFQWQNDKPYNWEFLDPYLSGRMPGPLIDAEGHQVLVAVDPTTYTVVWSKLLPIGGTYGTGGFLPTAGGLAFHRLADGLVIAYDATTGKDLWSWQTGTAAPQPAYLFSYMAGGEQYVAVPQGKEIIAFKLGGTLPQRPAPAIAPNTDWFRGQPEDTQLIRAHSATEVGYRWAIAPQKARVKVGVPVIFANNGAEVRDFSDSDGTWTTGAILPREVKPLTFDKPGRYLVRDSRHPWSLSELIVVADTPAAAPAPQASAADAFAAQATRGKRSYDETCSACHGADLGGKDFAPALVGQAFLAKYPNAKDLYDRTRTTMPQGAPGSISNAAYLDIVAHVLKANGKAPAGGVALGAVNAAQLKL